MANKVGRPLAFESVEELQEKVEEYFDTAAYINTGDTIMFAPTMAGLARHLKVDRKTVLNYSNKEEYFPTIKDARCRIEEVLEQRLYGNAVTGTIFNLKNNFDWKDKQEIDQSVDVKSGVMMVPGIASIDEWSKVSEETQAKLKSSAKE